MAYDDLKTQYGRRLELIARVRLPRCALTFGVGACPAVLGGGTKCYNTLATCPVPQAYDGSSELVVSFTSEFIPGYQQPGDPPALPLLAGIDTAPSVLEPGKGLGVRASCTVSLQDAPWTDVGLDPYQGESHRPVDPDQSGSGVLARLLRRQRYWEGRTLEILTGYLDEDDAFDAANFRTRTYLIDRIQGPDDQGRVVIRAKDPLRAADGERATCPVPSTGTLALAVDEVATVLQLGSGQAAEYQVLGTQWVRIGGEIMEVTAIDTVLDRLTVVRASLPSFYDAGAIEATEHDAGATVQHCVLFNGQRIDAVLYDLLTTWARVDPAFIDLPAWSLFADTWLASLTVRRLIAEPTAVKDLLVELTEHLAMLWWDDRDQTIRLDAVRPGGFGEDLPTWDEDAHLLADGIDLDRRSEDRLSRVFVWFGHRSPLSDKDKPSSYRRAQVSADLDQELPERYGSVRQRAIFSRWLTQDQGGIALEISGRLLNEYRDQKVVARVAVDPKDDEIWTGDRFRLRTRQIVDEHGVPVETGFLVLEAREEITGDGARYAYRGIEVAVSGRIAIIAPDRDPAGVLISTDRVILADDTDELVDNADGGVFPDYSAAFPTQRRWAFISTNAPAMLNGDAPYVIG